MGRRGQAAQLLELRGGSGRVLAETLDVRRELRDLRFANGNLGRELSLGGSRVVHRLTQLRELVVQLFDPLVFSLRLCARDRERYR